MADTATVPGTTRILPVATALPAAATAPVDAGPAVLGAGLRTGVDFRGERSGQAPLTWGQRAIWHAIGRTAPNDHYFNIGRILPLADRGRPATVDGATRALGALVERHEALRTRVAPGADGQPGQILAATGVLPVTVVPAPDTATAASAAQEVLDGLSATRFDYRGEWPLRAALVAVGDQVTHAVLVLCHLAADGHAAEALVRDLRLLVRRGSAGRPPATAPLDLAHEQHGEAGLRRGAAALAHWEAGYRASPATMFPRPAAEPRTPRFWTGRIVSPALARAVPVVAATHRVSGSTVLLAASAALVAAGQGHRTAAVMPIAGNRTAAAHRDLVTTLSQDGLFVLDLGADMSGSSFTDLLPDAYRAALRAYRAAAYDPVAWDALAERLRQEYGHEVHPYCCFNDMRLVERPVAVDAPATPEELDAARSRTAFGFPATQDRVACRYCLHITEEGDALAVALTADTAYQPPDAIRAHLYAMEELIVSSAAGRPPLLSALPGLLETAGRDAP